MKSTWPSEIRQHSNFRWAVIVGGRRKKAKILYHGVKLSQQEGGRYHAPSKQPVIFLVNYDGVKNIFRELVKCPWDAIFLDESTKIKSPHTSRTTVMWALGKHIPRRYILTGFPATENLMDIYPQVKFLDDSNLLGSSHHAFMNTYFVKMGMKVLPKRRKVQELMDKIAPFCIHMTNKSLFVDLMAARRECRDSALEIDGVPKCEGGREEGQPARSKPLLFVAVIANLPETVDEQRWGEGVARSALVEAGVHATTDLHTLQPVKDEERPLDSAEFPECHRESVLSRVADELSQYQRGRHGPLPDRCRKPENLVQVHPYLANVDCTANERGQRGVGMAFLVDEELRGP